MELEENAPLPIDTVEGGMISDPVMTHDANASGAMAIRLGSNKIS